MLLLFSSPSWESCCFLVKISKDKWKWSSCEKLFVSFFVIMLISFYWSEFNWFFLKLIWQKTRFFFSSCTTKTKSIIKLRCLLIDLHTSLQQKLQEPQIFANRLGNKYFKYLWLCQISVGNILEFIDCHCFCLCNDAVTRVCESLLCWCSHDLGSQTAVEGKPEEMCGKNVLCLTVASSLVCFYGCLLNGLFLWHSVTFILLPTDWSLRNI